MHFRSAFIAILLLCLLVVGCEEQALEAESLEWPSDYTAPLQGATFSLSANHLPNAERTYRNGIHKGFDFFDGLSSAPVPAGTPVVAVADGEVIRIDQAYIEAPGATLERYTRLAPGDSLLADFAMDQLRGRQVWLLHEGGYVSRYAHLSAVSEGIAPGDEVVQGAVLGDVGATGTPPSDDAGTADAHLHYELWHPAGDYMGKGLSPLDIHRLVGQVFGAEALPRYSRQVLARTDAGHEPPPVFPPESLPDPNIRVNPPDEVTANQPFAISLTWDDEDAVRVDEILAVLSDRPLGVIDAGNGAWIVGTAEEPGEAILAFSIVDQYGQTLSAGRELEVTPSPGVPAPIQWPANLLDRYEPELQHQEKVLLMQAAQAAYEVREVYWQEAFQAPLSGTLIRTFGQKVFHDSLPPALPLSGIYLMPDEEGGPVTASNAGRVFFAGEMPLRGNTVVINHGGGVVTLYAHLDEIHVEADQRVERGGLIGTSGASGAMDSEVLRWEFQVMGVPSDPLGWLDRLLPEQH